MKALQLLALVMMLTACGKDDDSSSTYGAAPAPVKSELVLVCDQAESDIPYSRNIYYVPGEGFYRDFDKGGPTVERVFLKEGAHSCGDDVQQTFFVYNGRVYFSLDGTYTRYPKN